MSGRCVTDAGRLARSASGFSLLEILVTVTLFGILIVPLATGVQSALGAANGVRGHDADLATAAERSGSADAWTWGSQVESVVWRPGPDLEVAVEVPASVKGSVAVVGLWADGWFLGEHPTDGDGVCRVVAPEWRGTIGRELIVRVRRAEGLWGPPWRSIVPDRTAEGPEIAEIEPKTMGEIGLQTREWTALHTPAFANPALWTGTGGAQVKVDSLGLLFLTGGTGSGRRDLGIGPQEAGGHVQSWHEEDDRALDAYF